MASGPGDRIRKSTQTFREPRGLLTAGRLEYGISGGSCRGTPCRATGNVDLHYGVSERWTVRGGVDRFWRDTLPDLPHAYARGVASRSTTWTVTLDGVTAAFARAGLRYEPSIDRRVTAEYTRYAEATVAPVLTPPGARSRLVLFGFWRPIRRAGFFFFDGTLDRQTSLTGTTTLARLESSTEGRAVRALPFMRLERDAPVGVPAVSRWFTGASGVMLPRPGLGPVLGAIWLRGGGGGEAGGPPRLSADSLPAAPPPRSGRRGGAG